MGALDFLKNIISRPTVVASAVKENTKQTITPTTTEINNNSTGWNVFSGINLKPLTPVAQEIKQEIDTEQNKTMFQKIYDAGIELYNKVPTILNPIKAANKGLEIGEDIYNSVRGGFEKVSSDINAITSDTSKTNQQKIDEIGGLPSTYGKQILSNATSSLKTMPEGISSVAKGLLSMNDADNLYFDVANKVTGKYTMILNDQQNVTEAVISTLNEPESQTIDTFKSSLLSKGVPARIVNGITEEGIQDARKTKEAGEVELQKKGEKLGAESLKSGLSTDISSMLPGRTTVSQKQSLGVANAISIYDPVRNNIDEVKSQALSFGVDKKVVDAITGDNIIGIKKNVSDWMTKNSIEGIGVDGGFTYNDGSYIVTYDKDNNIKSAVATTKLTKPITDLKNNYGLGIKSKEEYGKLITEIVNKANPTATPTEIQSIVLDMNNAFYGEIMSTANHIVGSKRLIDKEIAAGEFDLANKNTESLKKDIQEYNNWVNNVFELTKIKTENKLVGIELENYIEDKYGMNINNFTKRDENGKIMDTNGLPFPDHIISRQIDLDTEHFTKSSTQNVGQGIYHTLTNQYNKLAGDDIKKIPILFQRGTVKAQIEAIGGADPIPGFQYSEISRRAKNSAAGLSDEAFALFAPDIILSFVSGGASTADLISKLSKTDKVSDIAKGIKTAGKATEFINTAVKGQFNLINKGGELNKVGAYRSLLTNMGLNFLRDINGEARGQRVDPERGNDWNTNFAMLTFMLPYSWQGASLLKDLKVLGNGKSNINMMESLSKKLTNNDMKLDWSQLSQFRKADKKMFDGFIKEYNTLSEEGKVKAKKMLAAGFIGQESLDKGLKDIGVSKENYSKLDSVGKSDMLNKILETNIGKEEVENMSKRYVGGLSADEYARFFTDQGIVDFAGIAMTKPEVLAMAVGRGMRRAVDDTELNAKAIELAKLAENKDINILDMVKFSYGLPGDITYGALRSTLTDTPDMVKNFDTVVSKTADLGIVDPMLRYVGNGNQKVQAVIQTVFEKKFLPSKQFTAGEMLNAESKSKGTFLESLMTKEAGDYNPLYWNKQDGKYKLNDVGLSAIGANMQPNKGTLKEMAEEGNYKGISKMSKTYLDAGGNVAMTEKFIETVQKLLSDKLC